MAFHARDELSPSHFSHLSSTIDLFHHFLAFRYGLVHRAKIKKKHKRMQIRFRLSEQKEIGFLLLGRPLSAPSGLSALGFYGERAEEEKAERRPHLSPAQTDSAHFLKPSSSSFFFGVLLSPILSLSKARREKEQQSTKNWRERREATTPFFRQEEKGGGATQFGAVLSLTTLWAASGQANSVAGGGEDWQTGFYASYFHLAECG